MTTTLQADTHTAERIVFIGGGNMARSLIGGMIERGVDPAQIYVAEPSADARQSLSEAFGVAVGADNGDAVANADIVMLAVKPQVMRGVCEGIAARLTATSVCISIAAGLTSAQLDQWLGGGRAVVRAMPNTPSLLGAGATGVFSNAATSDAQRASAERLLAAVGISVRIDDEALMDAVTALSGSGPAYAFLLAESMQSAAQSLGLPEAAARELTAQTLLGAARMLSEGNEPAATLRSRVTSPGGTTQAAVETLIEGGFEALVRQAMEAAAQRGAELSKRAGDAT
jgi:pyrroline-5-carboxylate reductase